MKFKVGDKVLIVADESGHYQETVGKVGVIEDVDIEDNYPYKVRLTTPGTTPVFYNDNELELVTDEPTHTVGIIEELLTLMVTKGSILLIDNLELQAAFWIERRHGSTSALAYLKEALKDG